jgi:isoleucyl-tRNA synthetase
VREIASAGLALRKARALRVRLPLTGATIVDAGVSDYGQLQILEDELNVRKVTVWSGEQSALTTFGIERRLVVNARAAGPRLGKDVQRIIQAAKSGNWRHDDGQVVVDGVQLEEGEYELEEFAADETLAVAFLPGGGFIVLDTALTPELEAEGLARDVVRAVQQARKDAGLEVSDRIALRIAGDSAAVAAIGAHRELIAAETLATSLDAREAELAGAGTAVGSGSAVTIEVERA